MSLHAEFFKGSSHVCFQKPILNQKKVMAHLAAHVGAHKGAKWKPKGCCNFETVGNWPPKTNKNRIPKRFHTSLTCCNVPDSSRFTTFGPMGGGPTTNLAQPSKKASAAGQISFFLSKMGPRKQNWPESLKNSACNDALWGF